MGDLIDRQAAIDALRAMAVPRYKDPACEGMWERDRTLDNAIDVMRELPSVALIRKKGKWVKVTNDRGGHECNICHAYAPSYQNGDERLSEFCPHCGAKMEVPKEG